MKDPNKFFSQIMSRKWNVTFHFNKHDYHS
jgi:hypothetical protein